MWQDPCLPGHRKHQTPSALSYGELRSTCILDFGIMKWVQPLQPITTVRELGLGLTLCKGTELRRMCVVFGTPPLSWSTGFLMVLYSNRRRVVLV